MKRLLLFSFAFTLLVPQSETYAQPTRLLASSVHFANGSYDTTRYYYSGSRGGWHRDAGGDILPRQLVQRDGSLEVMYDSALLWSGNTATGTPILTQRFSNIFDANDRVVLTTQRKYGTQSLNRGEQYSYNSAGNHILVGFIDSAETWPSMAPGFFKSSTYNSSNLPVSDTFYYSPQFPVSGFYYRYNGSGQQEDVLQFTIVPTPEVVDSAHFTWYPNGLLQIEHRTLLSGGQAVAGIRDTFGYAGSNPQYTYRRNDQLFNGSSDWETVWLAINTLNPANGKHDTMSNYYNIGTGPVPPNPTQLLVAAYNADSTLDRVSYYSPGNPVPGIVYRYYYSLQAPASVSNAGLLKPLLHVYPVPVASSGAVTVRLQGVSGEVPYTVSSIDGKVVLSGSMRAGTELHIQNLSAGQYVIRCAALSGRIVVE